MDLWSIIKETYPDLEDREFRDGAIRLQDDGDGIQYIAKWELDLPLPKGLKIGK